MNIIRGLFKVENHTSSVENADNVTAGILIIRDWEALRYTSLLCIPAFGSSWNISVALSVAREYV